ncbi:MAG: hypothetical protein JWL83_3959 [Actinomycetia bacterium]|nr:hypothetical protein [Actinomycetes bacterium]
MPFDPFAGDAARAVERVPYHIGLVTTSLEAAQASLFALFDVEWTPVQLAEELEFFGSEGHVRCTARTVHSTGPVPLRFEVVEGGPGTVWHTDRELELHHLAYWSPDVAADVGALTHDGWSLELTALDDHGRPSVFAYMRKPDLPRIEVVSLERHARYSALVCFDVSTSPFSVERRS